MMPNIKIWFMHSTAKHDLSMHVRFFLLSLPLASCWLIKVLIGQCYQYAILRLSCFLPPALQWFCWKNSVITVSWSLTCVLTADSTSESKTAGFCSWSTLYVQSIHQSTNQPINQSVNQSTNKSINQSISQSINQPINQSISQPINQSTNQSVNQSTNKSIKSVWSLVSNQMINPEVKTMSAHN